MNIEQRLKSIEENVLAIKNILEELLNKQPMQPFCNEDIMNVKQLAMFLKMDANLIYLKCRKGELPYFKIGKQYKFKKDAVLKSMKEQKQQSDLSVDAYVDTYMQKHILKA